MAYDLDNTRGSQLAIAGVLLNGLLAITKLVVGIVGHSTALIADGVESITDIVGSAIVWGGIRIARKPPDENHPYGHGKAEALAAIIVALMLIAAAVWIGIESVHQIITPHVAPEPYTLWVLFGIIGLKEMMFQLTHRVAKKNRSAAMAAEAWHHRSDAITSIAAAIGISIALVGGPGYETADAWAALIAALIIFYNAIRIIRPPIGELMDTESADVTEQARTIAEQVPEVVLVEKALARKSGTRHWLDMHIEVDPEMTVHEAHEVAHCVKEAIRAAMPAVADVLIHIEPAGNGDSSRE